MPFGQINTPGIISIIIVYIVILIGCIMWNLHAVAARRVGGVCQKDGVFWMRICTIVGRMSNEKDFE